MPLIDIFTPNISWWLPCDCCSHICCVIIFVERNEQEVVLVDFGGTDGLEAPKLVRSKELTSCERYCEIVTSCKVNRFISAVHQDKTPGRFIAEYKQAFPQNSYSLCKHNCADAMKWIVDWFYPQTTLWDKTKKVLFWLLKLAIGTPLCFATLGCVRWPGVIFTSTANEALRYAKWMGKEISIDIKELRALSKPPKSIRRLLEETNERIDKLEIKVDLLYNSKATSDS